MSVISVLDYGIISVRLKLSSVIENYNVAEPTPVPTPNDSAREINMNNPMKILDGEGVDIWKGKDLADNPVNLFSTGALYVHILRFLYVMSVVVIICSLISMLYINKSERLAEKKKDIMHKLMIVFLASSSIAILNLFASIAKKWL